jgi:hypothetical protein
MLHVQITAVTENFPTILDWSNILYRLNVNLTIYCRRFVNCFISQNNYHEWFSFFFGEAREIFSVCHYNTFDGKLKWQDHCHWSIYSVIRQINFTWFYHIGKWNNLSLWNMKSKCTEQCSCNFLRWHITERDEH